ncbi:MAG: alanine--tRNA ligase [Bacteroidales bacterium]|nr:alanine--tRNA ligase [Bacteroidales bacterium]
MTSAQIRKTFLDFFANKQHHIVDSAPMVVKNDPTLMFTNAGMNQFKDLFIGHSLVKYPRIADTQKCLRVSGKHNDLEEVGHDTYHHTMFEMLGNWSFGDYFKKEAIEYAWELLTEVYKIPKENLYVTVFEGDEKDGTSKDMEAYDLWKKIVSEDQILFGNKKDNFWEMGDTGPCGPCSEIHVDIRSAEEKSKIPGRDLVNQDHPQVIEVWNLVFMQFNRMANGSLVELPAKHVDTGMGFERLCMVVQGKQSNYDTDVFQPIIQHLARLCNQTYGKDLKQDIAMRVIADHLRAVSFAIADGQLPSNNKAGYVIRRILRRAVRYGYTFLNFREPFMCQLVQILSQEMGEQFKELKSQQELITKVIAEEEASFLKTLESGIRLLDQIMEKAKASAGSATASADVSVVSVAEPVEAPVTQISGHDAFVLYDTFGFPFDLTDLILKENGLTVSYEDFEKELNQQKERSRAAGAVETDDWTTVRSGEETSFVGYDEYSCEVKILKYRKVSAKNKTYFQLVLDKTPFYAESGGQVGDRGVLVDSENNKIPVFDTKKENNLMVHLCLELPKNLEQTFTAQIDVDARLATTCNHSAAHLLHHVLRKVLGTHVEQKGSAVRPEGLRFDFSHFQKVTDEEIRNVERMVNAEIRKCMPLVESRNISMDKALEKGALMLFGEKYGDDVRVIELGESAELCGGTHVLNSGQLGSFKIISESAIAAGVRRIEAVTAKEAENLWFMLQDSLKELREIFKSPNLKQAMMKTIQDNEDLKKQVGDFIEQRKQHLKKMLLARAQTINHVQLIEMPDNEHTLPEIIKGLTVDLRKEIPNLVFIVKNVQNDRSSITLTLGDDLVKAGLNASTLIKEAAKFIDGSGGGQPFSATASGTKLSGFADAVAYLKGKLI